jgi:hypothetical protein
VGVAQTQNELPFGGGDVGAAEGESAEVAEAVAGGGVLFVDDFESGGVDGDARVLNEGGVGEGCVGGGRGGRGEGGELLEADFVGSDDPKNGNEFAWIVS